MCIISTEPEIIKASNVPDAYPHIGQTCYINPGFMSDMFDAMHRVICKELAMDTKRDFVDQECAVEASNLTF